MFNSRDASLLQNFVGGIFEVTPARQTDGEPRCFNRLFTDVNCFSFIGSSSRGRSARIDELLFQLLSKANATCSSDTSSTLKKTKRNRARYSLHTELFSPAQILNAIVPSTAINTNFCFNLKINFYKRHFHFLGGLQLGRKDGFDVWVLRLDVNFDYFSKQREFKLKGDLFCLSSMRRFLKEDSRAAELRKNTYGAGMLAHKYEPL